MSVGKKKVCKTAMMMENRINTLIFLGKLYPSSTGSTSHINIDRKPDINQSAKLFNMAVEERLVGRLKTHIRFQTTFCPFICVCKNGCGNKRSHLRATGLRLRRQAAGRRACRRSPSVVRKPSTRKLPRKATGRCGRRRFSG